MIHCVNKPRRFQLKSIVRFTPGPWIQSGPIVLAGFDSVDFVRTVARVQREQSLHFKISQLELLSNAHLISAAPEMYDLLATIENDNGQVPEWLWLKIQDCLAKARGE